MTEYFVIEPCASSNGIEIKLRERKLDLKKAETVLSAMGELVASSPVVLLVKIKKYTISVYSSGRMMVKGAKKPESSRIEALARELLQALEKGGAIS
ncbi:MAG: hypothetical protein U0R44_06460 [Candidatus Micrarchaeia archaeon]